MSRAPSNVSSAGWNMKRTVPFSDASSCLSSLAALSSMAAWKSCPQACALSPVGQAKGSPLISGMGSASMSARSSSTGLPLPTSARTPCPHGSGERPAAFSCSST